MQIARMRMPAFFCIENNNDILANLFLKSYPSALSGSGERVEAYSILLTQHALYSMCVFTCAYSAVLNGGISGEVWALDQPSSSIL
jgi:hypothetical protein